MACAVPVVGADLGGNAELIETSGAGRTFVSGDASDLARRLTEVLTLPVRSRRALGEKGRAYVTSELTWDAVCRRILARYKGRGAMAVMVSIHDVAPPTLGAVRQLRELLSSWGARHVTLLAVPNFHGQARLDQCGATVAWLRQRAAAGDEVALHGFTHQQEHRLPGMWPRLKARAFTAGEGEYLSVPPHHVAQRLASGRRIVEDVTGAAVQGFVAPAWLEPSGLAERLAAQGFAWHETAWSLEALSPRRRHRAPVIGFATRSFPRRVAAAGWARLVSRLKLEPRRIALHPADVTSPFIMRAIERTVRLHLEAHAATTTAAWLAADAASGAPRT